MTLALEEVEEAVSGRLSSPLIGHVASVARTVGEVARRARWSDEDREAATRAAWFHDAVKDEGRRVWLRRIREAGEEPDPWAAVRAPILLHAHAAAIWAAETGEADARVLAAVRHHPTAHPDWGSIGRLLFVADFCEPTREFADALGTGRLRERAGRSGNLAEVARVVLRLRLAWHLERDHPIHPRSVETWNAWTLEGDP